MLHEERQTRSAAVLPRTSGFLVRDIDRSGLGEAPAPLCSTGVSRSAHRREASYGIIRLKRRLSPWRARRVCTRQTGHYRYCVCRVLVLDARALPELRSSPRG